MASIVGKASASARNPRTRTLSLLTYVDRIRGIAIKIGAIKESKNMNQILSANSFVWGIIKRRVKIGASIGNV